MITSEAFILFIFIGYILFYTHLISIIGSFHIKSTQKTDISDLIPSKLNDFW
jgi:hypothetical protein